MAQMSKVGTTATKVQSNSNGLIVRYHDTDVVTINDLEIILNTGGWFTSTTKTRMNQASNQYKLGFYVKQINHKWYCDYKGQCFNFDNNVLKLER